MSDFQTIFSLARRSLMVLCMALTLTLALYWGSSHFKQQGKTQLDQAQQLLSAIQASIAEKQSALAGMQAEIGHFNLLRQQGVVGTPEREVWVEQLVTSRQRTGLPDTLVYTLQAPKPLATQAGSPTGVEAAPALTPAGTGTAAPSGAFFHDLDIELGSIHEEELLALLRDYQAQVKGRFRVNACTLSERTATGLSARCTLRFFTLSDVTANAGPK